jgi:hypothetical protein
MACAERGCNPNCLLGGNGLVDTPSHFLMHFWEKQFVYSVFWQMHLKWDNDIEICNYSWLQLLLGESVDVIFPSSFIDFFNTFIFEKHSTNILCNFLIYFLWF